MSYIFFPSYCLYFIVHNSTDGSFFCLVIVMQDLSLLFQKTSVLLCALCMAGKERDRETGSHVAQAGLQP